MSEVKDDLSRIVKLNNLNITLNKIHNSLNILEEKNSANSNIDLEFLKTQKEKLKNNIDILKNDIYPNDIA